MVHQFKNNGYNILLDVSSGAIHVVDDVVYDLIPLIEPLAAEGVKEPAAVGIFKPGGDF